MKSKTKLFEFLARHFNKQDVRIGTHNISDETYGKTSCIYLWNIQKVWGVTREALENMLIAEGFKVNKKYGRGMAAYKMNDYDATEVTVSFFKGWHWDE